MQIRSIPHRPVAVSLADWDLKSEPQRLAFMRGVSESASQDPRLKEQVVAILTGSDGFLARAYEEHLAKLLAWTQQNVRYVNEKGEVIQDPLYTLQQKYGDCDDQVVLLASMVDSLGYPWWFTLAGKDAAGNTYRWVEGQPKPLSKSFSPIEWVHIYLLAGWPPFGEPAEFRWMDPTIGEAPLGYDVIGKGHGFGAVSAAPIAIRNGLPELADEAAVSSKKKAPSEYTSDIVTGVVVGVVTAVISSAVLAYFKMGRSSE